MSKFIDAEKLRSVLQNTINSMKEKDVKGERYDAFLNGKLSICEELLGCIDSLQQEHPEVDLEKFTEKIKTFQGRYKHPEIVSIKGAMAFMARMFYQYPNVARQWYEQLPKATMD